MANILFVTYLFAPENASGTHRGLHFARALHDAGHSVTVLTAPEPAPDRADPSLNAVFPWPDRIHRVQPAALSFTNAYLRLKGMKRSLRGAGGGATTPTEGGPAAGAPKATLPNRRGRLYAAATYLPRQLAILDAFPDYLRGWGEPAVRTGIALGREHRFDLVFVSGPPWTGMMTGYRIAKALGVPLIADYRDPWTHESGATWVQYQASWAEARGRRWDARVLANAAIVSFNSPRLAAVTAARARLGDRVRVFLNGSDIPRSTAVAVLPPSSPLIFRHFGALYGGRTVSQLVTALDKSIASDALRPDEVRVELIGDVEMSEAEGAQFAASKVQVRTLAHMPFAKAAALMAEPSVLVSVQGVRHTMLTPTKVFDYLCVGNPLLIVSPEESASWDVARAYPRAYRFDFTATDHNDATLASLLEAWRGGRLRRERTVEDTRALLKSSVGAEFVRLVEEITAPPAARPRA